MRMARRQAIWPLEPINVILQVTAPIGGFRKHDHRVDGGDDPRNKVQVDSAEPN